MDEEWPRLSPSFSQCWASTPGWVAQRGFSVYLTRKTKKQAIYTLGLGFPPLLSSWIKSVFRPLVEIEREGLSQPLGGLWRCFLAASCFMVLTLSSSKLFELLVIS